MTDCELLTAFVQSASREAMNELISRHVSFVYAAALRQTRDPHLAEDVTQVVFITLAQKAGRLSPKIVLEGWLFNTVRFTALNAMKQENRLKRREAAAARPERVDAQIESDLAAAGPHLDKAIAKLNEGDRLAVILRFFKGMSLRDVGAAVGTSEDGARMRVNRGLEKLRGHLTAEGVTASVALPAILEAAARQAAPQYLAQAIATATPAAKTLAASHGLVWLIKGHTVAAAVMGVMTVSIGAVVVTQLSAGPQAAAAPATQPAVAAAPTTKPDSPVGAMTILMHGVYDGDRDAVRTVILLDNPSANAMIDAVTDYAKARTQAMRALEAKWGPLTPRQHQPFDQLMPGTAAMFDVVLPFVPIEINGDKAVISLPENMADPHDFYMAKVGDAWKLDIATTLQPMLTKEGYTIDSMTAAFAGVAKACKDLDAGVQAGTYKSANEALRAFAQSQNRALMLMMPPATKPTTMPK